MALAPSARFTKVNGAIGTTRTAATGDPGADAIEPRTQQPAQRILAEPSANSIKRESAREYAQRRIDKAKPGPERSNGRRNQDDHRECYEPASHEGADHQQPRPTLLRGMK